MTDPFLGVGARGYVTEPFSKSRHVKVNGYDRNNPDHTIALKLNIVEEWRTGVYKYRLMTSHFFDTQAQMVPLKTVFSSQEWCGITYEELLWHKNYLAVSIKSYFDGESADLQITTPHHLTDSLWVLARGFFSGGPSGVNAWPTQWIESSKERRLNHLDLVSFDAEPQRISSDKKVIPSLGEIDVQTLQFSRKSGEKCQLMIETHAPHRVVGWQCVGGEQAILLGSLRTPYWSQSKLTDVKYLERLGVSDRLQR